MKIAFDILTDLAQKEFWAALALRHCEHMTPRLLRALLVHYGSAYATFCSIAQQKTLTQYFPKKLIPKAIINSLRREKWRTDAHHEWRLSKSFQGEIILWTDYRYPLGLKQIIDAPAFFYARGDTSLLASPSVAIVGSRKYHQNTLEKTYEIAQDLSACGICVISGMAKGIDFAAHSGALKEIGKSIAVLGCGADIIYPAAHAQLYDEIGESGLIISEFAPQTQPLSENFPIRNRIISGLSEAVLVAEAAPRSGSLITARLALEQNRNVYVLKPMHENHSLGCHALIQDGAVQVEDALSIIADIAPNLQEKLKVNESSHASKEQIILSSNTQDTKSIHKKQGCKIKELSQTAPRKKVKEIQNTIGIIKNTANIENTESIKNTENTVNRENTKKVVEIVAEIRQDSADRIYPAQMVKKRSNHNETLPILDIDFANLAGELMGELRTYNASDILTQRTKKKEKSPKKAKSESIPSHGEVFFQDKYASHKQTSHEYESHEHRSHEHRSPENTDKRNLNNEKIDERDNKNLHGAEVLKDRTGLGDFEKAILCILDEKKELVPDEILVRLPLEMQDISTLSMALLILEVDKYTVRLSGNRYKNI